MARGTARGTTSRWQRTERGQGAVTLAVVAVVLVAAVALLLRTATLANNIDRKIENIAQTGRGINEATDAILELDTTNNLGRSILETSSRWSAPWIRSSRSPPPSTAWPPRSTAPPST